MTARTEPTFPSQGVFRQADGSLLWRVWAPFHEHVTLVTWPGGERTETPMTAVGNGYFEADSSRSQALPRNAMPERLRLERTQRRAATKTDEPQAEPAAPGVPRQSLGTRPAESEQSEASVLHYAYKLSHGPERPDPASRWQPDGVHRPSAVFFPGDFTWTDQDWRGIPREDLVIYELHVGTFTPEGTFDAVIPRLPELAELGITAVELMPVAQFAGTRNWGYDGVHPFAVQNSYGGPKGLQRLVDAAHRAGLAVFLDVVYNHLGPEGNYLSEFGPYFTDRYHTPWGSAVNYDRPDCDPVRQYVCDNACMWVRDFHVDGLRLDAVHAIYDFSAHHISAQLQQAVQAEAWLGSNQVSPQPSALGAALRSDSSHPAVHVIAETSQNDVRLIHPPDRGGYGLDGVWCDDFHHSVHALLTGERDGYYEDFGEPEDLVKAFNNVFVYDGCYSRFRRRRHGSQVGDLDRTHFVVCIKNHDQVGNRALGDRFSTLLPPAAFRLATGLLLLSPCVPLIFMGDEYAETRPFPFFCSFGDPELIEAVRRGRRQEFADLKFQWGENIPDPQDERTFRSAQLSWQWPEHSPPRKQGMQAGMRRLVQDLLSARRAWPALRDRQHTTARLIGVLDNAVLLLERGRGEERLVACANLTPNPQPLDRKAVNPVPPLELTAEHLILSTEEERYGGSRQFNVVRSLGERTATRGVSRPHHEDLPDKLHPYELLILGSGERR